MLTITLVFVSLAYMTDAFKATLLHPRWAIKHGGSKLTTVHARQPVRKISASAI
jgi:hypothetical protein